MLKRDVLAQERSQRLHSIEAESIIIQIDRVQFLAFEQGREQTVQRLRDLGEETAGEDVGEVGVAEVVLRFEDLGESGGGFDADGVAFEVDLFNVGVVAERLDVLFKIGGGVELEGAAFEGEDVGHGGGV